MATIKLGNGNNLSISDDNSNGDTIIVGNGINDGVSALNSSYDTITLGAGAGDLSDHWIWKRPPTRRRSFGSYFS